MRSDPALLIAGRCPERLAPASQKLPSLPVHSSRKQHNKRNLINQGERREQRLSM